MEETQFGVGRTEFERGIYNTMNKNDDQFIRGMFVFLLIMVSQKIRAYRRVVPTEYIRSAKRVFIPRCSAQEHRRHRRQLLRRRHRRIHWQ
jgi:hypothetical protein